MSAADLHAVDELCRLAVEARRLGCHLHVVDADAGLRSLIDLAGVDDVLRPCPSASPVPRPSQEIYHD